MADEEELVVSLDGEDDGVVHEEDASAVLKKQYDDLVADNKRRQEREEAANRRAVEAANEANRAREEVRTARSEVADRELDTIVSGIAAAQAKADAAQRDYEAAEEAGDVKKKAEAQRRMARAEAEAFRLEEAKGDLEARKAAPRNDDAPAARVAVDPFEEYVSQRTPRTADWMRQHRDWVVDPRKGAKLTGAHHMAVGEGLTPDSDEYFEYVEKTLGIREADTPQRNGSTNGQTRTQTRRSTPPVAPVNGGAGAHSSGANDNRGENSVRLTKAEAASATDGTLQWNYDDPSGKKRFKKGDPIGLQEMARRKQAMQKQGLYDKNNIEA
jgi:hypothetical protein